MGSSDNGAKKNHTHNGLADLVLSWTLQHIFNKHLYKDKVKLIPETFPSAQHYLKSFIYPLIEETHADMLSGMMGLPQAPICEISKIWTHDDYKPPNNFLYEIEVKVALDDPNGREIYEPQGGDIVLLSSILPMYVSDLSRPPRYYFPAIIVRGEDEEHYIQIRALKPIMGEGEDEAILESLKMERHLYVVFLINIMTNMRIWNSLHGGSNKKIIKMLLQADSKVGDSCDKCSLREVFDGPAKRSIAKLNSLSMNFSQMDAVLSSIAASYCHHKKSVKLIWGPPGTGKTKAVAALVWALLALKCRTITCAPTNIAVVEVATRLLMLVRGELRPDCYGLGDIVLFGNRERLKIDDHDDLFDVFLNFRAEILVNCFNPLNGWRPCVNSLIWFLEYPKTEYELYLQNMKKENEQDDSGKSEEERKVKGKAKCVQLGKNENKKAGKADVDTKTRKQRRCKEKPEVHVENQKEETMEGCDRGKETKAEDEKKVCALTFLEFTRKELFKRERNLNLCIRNMCKHLPTSSLSLNIVGTMNKALALLEALRIALKRPKNEELENDLNQGDGVSCKDGGSSSLLNDVREDCLDILKFLRSEFDVPKIVDEWSARKFCLSRALLIFCTTSSSALLHVMRPFDMLVVDEAAQLKECESAIPLRIPGLRHAILIGDEFQLPATIKSQISADAELGRSLFQRLVSLGQPKHLLNIQYRMHPSISLFPNKEFYNNQIFDASNVLEKSYRKQLLKGKMFGPYSFINVGYGREQFDEIYSRKNVVEAALVSELVASLYKVSVASKEKVSVGVISPYKAQVRVLKKEIENKYDHNENFSVRVRSIDGFQGGEDDVIILSTVRSNGNGSIGFLSNRQRTNVALTRARHCLWILGNEPTLVNSNSVWTKLVLDAKRRDCLFSAEDDDKLAEVTAEAMIKLGQIDELLDSDSLLFRGARWKVIIGEGLVASFMKLKDLGTKKKLLFLLKKLASGWRNSSKAQRKHNSISVNGTCSQLLERYHVVGQYYLLWTVDIVKEDKKYTQILMFWDALQLHEIPKLAQHLDSIFGNYSVNTINRCKYKCVKSALAVPMSWEIDTIAASSSNGNDEDSQWLSSKLSLLALEEGHIAVAPSRKFKEKKDKLKHLKKDHHLLTRKGKNV